MPVQRRLSAARDLHQSRGEPGFTACIQRRDRSSWRFRIVGAPHLCCLLSMRRRDIRSIVGSCCGCALGAPRSSHQQVDVASPHLHAFLKVETHPDHTGCAHNGAKCLKRLARKYAKPQRPPRAQRESRKIFASFAVNVRRFSSLVAPQRGMENYHEGRCQNCHEQENNNDELVQDFYAQRPHRSTASDRSSRPAEELPLPYPTDP